MIWRVRSLPNRWLDASGNRLRVWPSPDRGWSFRTRLVAVGAAFLLSSWLTITSVSYFGSHQLLSEAQERIRELQQASAELSAEAELLSSAFPRADRGLETQTAQQEAAIAELTGISTALQDRLAAHERQLASVAEERNRARELVDEMQQAIAGAEDLLGAVAEDRWPCSDGWRRRRTSWSEVSGAADASRRVEVGLRWQLARLEDEAERLRSHRDGAQSWLKDWVLGSVEALEELLVATGVDVEELVARAGDAGSARPRRPAAGRRPGRGVATAAPDAIRSAAHPTPGAAAADRADPAAGPPLDQFHVTSPYGKRRDPFTKSWAFHPGVDLGAPRRATVLATAPGRVVFAGPSGPTATWSRSTTAWASSPATPISARSRSRSVTRSSFVSRSG